MPLGRQFRNTYWHDAEGAHASEVIDAMPGEPLIHSLPEHRNAGLPPLQGMLFSPYAATGLRQDPLVPAGRRGQTIKDALDLNDVEKYRTRLGQMIPSQTKRTRRLDENGQPLQTERRSQEYETTSKRGPKAAKEDMDLIAQTLDDTDMPTHVIAGTRAKAALDPNSGRAYAEDYLGRIRLTTDKKVVSHTVPEHTETRPSSVTPGAPLRNANFHSQVQKMEWDSEEGAHSDLVRGGKGNWRGGGVSRHPGADVHFWTPGGEEVHPNDDSHAEGQEHIVEADVHANIWPGSGKTTDKVVATPFTVYNGMSRGQEKFRTFHTRHEAVLGEPETVTVPASTTYEKVRTTSASTLTHELGHVRDPMLSDPFGHRKAMSHKADPLEEGLADGHADRYSRHAGKFEETLHPDYPGRSDEIKGARSGYGVDYHHWKGDKVGKALYVAARAHSAMSDDAVASVPSRRSMAQKFSIPTPEQTRTYEADHTTAKAVTQQADQMVLGHLYGEHEHVRAALHNLGMGNVGEEAHAAYQSSLEALQPKKSQQFEQLNLIQPTLAGGWVRQDGVG